MNLKEDIIITIVEKMSLTLNQEQLLMLENTLSSTLNEYKIKKKQHELITLDRESEKWVKHFLTTKHLIGCSEETLKTYSFHLKNFIRNLIKPLKKITSEDIRQYLAVYKARNKVKKSTLENIRLCLSSFFGWLHSEGMIKINPMKRIARFKMEKIIRKPFSDEDMEKLRASCLNLRDRALLEFMYSTGARVSEVAHLNLDQVSLDQGECTIYGKGAKERIVYLNAKSIFYLKKYLMARKGCNLALFVSERFPYKQLTKEGIEAIYRRMGKKAEIENCHPHRMRRTMATNALNRGMSLLEAKEILGHEKSDTTLIYHVSCKENIKLSHKKYIA